MNDDAQLQAFIDNLTPNQRNNLLKDLTLKKQQQDQAEHMRRYQTPDGIVRFARDVLKFDLAPYQERILRALVEHKRVAVRGPHGLGKSATAAVVVLWAVCVFDDVKVPTLASYWRQLEHYLWPEIRKWARPIRGLYDLRILNLAIKGDGKEAFAVASDDPASVEGAHADTLLYVFDESKIIPEDSWNAVEGAMSGAGADTAQDAYWLAISTPGAPSGRFYDIHSRKPGYQDWHVIHVTLEEAIAAGRISREWAEQRRVQWGEQSSVYQNRVLGNFSVQDEDSVIPLLWVEASNERWHAARGKGSGARSVGVDPARYGTDKTAIAQQTGRVVEQLDYHAQEDTMQTTGRAIVAAGGSKDVPIGVDVIGVGAGVVDRLKEQKYSVTGVNAASAAKDDNGQSYKDTTGTFEFINMRSYLWYGVLRWALDPDNPEPLALPPDDRMIGDLTAPKFSYTSKGQIQVESKDDIRKRLRRSTDAADAVALAEYVNPDRPGVDAGDFDFRQVSVAGRAKSKLAWKTPARY